MLLDSYEIIIYLDIYFLRRIIIWNLIMTLGMKFSRFIQYACSNLYTSRLIFKWKLHIFIGYLLESRYLEVIYATSTIIVYSNSLQKIIALWAVEEYTFLIKKTEKQAENMVLLTNISENSSQQIFKIYIFLFFKNGNQIDWGSVYFE